MFNIRELMALRLVYSATAEQLLGTSESLNKFSRVCASDSGSLMHVPLQLDLLSRRVNYSSYGPIIGIGTTVGSPIGIGTGLPCCIICMLFGTTAGLAGIG
jgi:hypothetical protein